jgi:hypothetical protein
MLNIHHLLLRLVMTGSVYPFLLTPAGGTNSGKAFPFTLCVLTVRYIAGINPLNAELNPICHLLALLGCATIVVVSRLRVNAGC